jgi:hypothetical protein
VAFPELQMPAAGLETTDDEMICRAPVDWTPPPLITQPVMDVLCPFVTEPLMSNC